MAQHGFYSHPYHLFCQGASSSWGFLCGLSPNNGLLQHMENSIQQFSPAVWKALNKKGAFPDVKEIHSKMVVCQYIGEGYKALYYILKHDHYAFMESPSTLISSFPRQQPKETTIGEYYQRFTDHLCLEAFNKPSFKMTMGVMLSSWCSSMELCIECS